MQDKHYGKSIEILYAKSGSLAWPHVRVMYIFSLLLSIKNGIKLARALAPESTPKLVFSFAPRSALAAAQEHTP